MTYALAIGLPSVAYARDTLARAVEPMRGLAARRPTGAAWSVAILGPLVVGVIVGGYQALLDLSSTREAYAAYVADIDREVETLALADYLASVDASVPGMWSSHDSATDGTVLTKGENTVRIADLIPNPVGYLNVRVSGESGSRQVPYLTVKLGETRCKSLALFLKTGTTASRIQVGYPRSGNVPPTWGGVQDWKAAFAACGDRGDPDHSTFRIRP